jgi:hypothetical protein
MALGYFAILGASIAGYAGVGPWVIAAAAVALASLSRGYHGELYERGRELGAFRIVDAVMLRSLGNALAAAGLAYGAGWVLKTI